MDGKGRSAIIVADTDAELAILKKDVFLDLLYKNPRNSVELMTILVDRLRKADEMIESLAFLEVGERPVRTLLEAAADDTTSTTGFRMTGKLTQKELAERHSREAVSKYLMVLSGKGIVKESEGTILIAHNALERLRHHERT